MPTVAVLSMRSGVFFREENVALASPRPNRRLCAIVPRRRRHCFPAGGGTFFRKFAQIHGGKIVAAPDAEFFVNASEVNAKGCFGNVQPRADFKILHAMLHKPGHFKFASGQEGQPCGRRGGRERRFAAKTPAVQNAAQREPQRVTERNEQEDGQPEQLEVDFVRRQRVAVDAQGDEPQAQPAQAHHHRKGKEGQT